MKNITNYVLTNKDRFYLSHIVGRRVHEVFLRDLALTDKQSDEFWLKNSLINSDYPLDYLLGEISIPELGCILGLNAHVLIPRTETIEWLKTCVLEQWLDNKIQVYELGTGSGLIGICLAKNNFSVVMTDNSDDALEVAQNNCMRNNLNPSSYKIILSDLLNNADLQQLLLKEKKWNLVANLPYVPLSDQNKTYSHSVQYEPAEAIYSGEDGLDLLKKLIGSLEGLPTPPTTIVLELDPRNIRLAQNLLLKNYHTTIRADYDGYERVLIARTLSK